ncbi:formylmethanofuran dehydrogenase subunit E [Methanosarcina thermophila MST-A1]|jgi:formylmethanofuran dehydrogenase subunit E|uniref:FmdE, Molybdenum formylmethanofuran dehydrogenase operon n=4 Tax=Methanosarcina thermophila TaxID=2210 RepID=A0A0E3NFD7_METTE|nr:FmdE, Molybdenum formylmethanofuran dehydrogenase operon [Methanosarcina thermophila TM-1]AKB15845.1 FmdE, Molybdenum formylmethanofuran dehydrogenase operon [Methanosarcina thermophila CHTI-55]BAW28527.1 formylmethanofuran dehydrogenase subunit E [Methanosarcina thermophila]GLI14522.1 formylmethanofuran dehydrogenase subunit E [Methanosarcina thermophila MST-A1]HOA67556.1 FmdE family protein [Methanosarcina thermophila]
METILEQVTDPELLSQIERVVSFHGFLTSGALIGIQMLNIARRELDIQSGERIYVTCETKSCMPDSFQILAGATIGNNGLKINNLGKMAVTVNKQAPEGVNSIKGIRIILDPEKTKAYPKLHAWYLNTEKFPHVEIVPILLEAGEKVYSWKLVDVEVPVRQKKRIQCCKNCNEMFVQHDNEVLCGACTE